MSELVGWLVGWLMIVYSHIDECVHVCICE